MKTVKSQIGGIGMIFIGIIMITYFIILMIDPWNKDKNDTKRSLNHFQYTSDQNTSHRDLATYSIPYTIKTSKTIHHYNITEQQTLHYPFYEGFNIGFRRGTTGEYDPTIYSFIFQILKGVSNLSSTPTRYCTTDDFPGGLDAQLAAVGVDYLVCVNGFEDKSIAFLEGIHINSYDSFNTIFVTGMMCRLFYQECNTEAEYGSLPDHISYHWVDAYYNPSTPSNPIKYSLTTHNQVPLLETHISGVKYFFVRQELHDIDGRVKNFWRLKRTRFFLAGAFVLGADIQISFFLSPEYYKYHQYYSYGTPISARRNLNTISATTIEAKRDEESQNSNGIFMFLYVISQLGGLFFFLITIFSLCIRPIVRKNLNQNSSLKSSEVVEDEDGDQLLWLNINPSDTLPGQRNELLKQFFENILMSDGSVDKDIFIMKKRIIEYRLHYIDRKIKLLTRIQNQKGNPHVRISNGNPEEGPSDSWQEEAEAVDELQKVHPDEHTLKIQTKLFRESSTNNLNKFKNVETSEFIQKELDENGEESSKIREEVKEGQQDPLKDPSKPSPDSLSQIIEELNISALNSPSPHP